VNKFCHEYHGPYTADKELGKRSRYCDSPRAGRAGVRSPVDERVVLVSVPFQTGPGAHSAYLEWIPVVFFGIKRPGRGVYDQLTLIGAEVRME
jgi:hypothetical protein